MDSLGDEKKRGSNPGVITNYLQDWRAGDPEALDKLTASLYNDLRRIAGKVLRGERSNRTVQPTVLVHELFFELPELQHIDWQNRAHFLNVAASVMRNMLVDYARKRRALKRGGGAETVLIEEPAGANDHRLGVDVLLVHELLERFAADYPRQAHVVELRFFGGLSEEETSEVLKATGAQSSGRTVSRDWAFAKAWLLKNMESPQSPVP